MGQQVELVLGGPLLSEGVEPTQSAPPPSRYVTWKGKTYLKLVMLAQANSALAQGALFILPVGVVFEPTTVPDLYVVEKPLPFPGRFLVRRQDGEGEPLHALAKAVKRVVSLPDKCPPVVEWEKSTP